MIIQEIKFAEFLVTFIGRKIIGLATKHTKNIITREIRNLANKPGEYGSKYGFSEFTDDQIDLIEDIIRTQYSFVQKPLKLVPRPFLETRPIAIIGPSGVGKSLISSRLAEKNINNDELPSLKLEKERIHIASWPPGIKILTIPGSSTHSDSAIQKVIDSITSEKPPKLICLTLCYGYHATGGNIYTGTFKRPGYRSNSASDLEDFLEKCLQEEIDYLNFILERIEENLTRKNRREIPTRIPSVLLILNKKDLWECNHKVEKVISRYREDSSSEFMKIMNQFRKKVGLSTLASYKIFPHYTYGGGFHPQKINGTAYEEAEAKASSLVLRALIYNIYKRS